MWLAVYAMLYMFLVYSWLLGEVHQAILVTLSVILALYGIYRMTLMKKRADALGWLGQDGIGFWMMSATTAFSVYILFAC